MLRFGNAARDERPAHQIYFPASNAALSSLGKTGQVNACLSASVNRELELVPRDERCTAAFPLLLVRNERVMSRVCLLEVNRKATRTAFAF